MASLALVFLACTLLGAQICLSLAPEDRGSNALSLPGWTLLVMTGLIGLGGMGLWASESVGESVGILDTPMFPFSLWENLVSGVIQAAGLFGVPWGIGLVVGIQCGRKS